jgi:hypothetical protein
MMGEHFLLIFSTLAVQFFVTSAYNRVNHKKNFDEEQTISLWFTQGKRENRCLLNSKNFPVFTQSGIKVAVIKNGTLGIRPFRSFNGDFGKRFYIVVKLFLGHQIFTDNRGRWCN